MDDLDCLVLFSGTWVWAAHLIPALRDFSGSGKGILLWTIPGSQGWRPVGGLVMHGGLKEVGIPHRFVYGGLRRSPDAGTNHFLLPGKPREKYPEYEHGGCVRWAWNGSDLRSG